MKYYIYVFDFEYLFLEIGILFWVNVFDNTIQLRYIFLGSYFKLILNYITKII